MLPFEAEFAESVLHILSYPESTVGPTMVGSYEQFSKKALRWLENAIFRLVFANIVFHKRGILLVFEAQVTGSVLLAATSTLRRLYTGVLDGNAD